MDRTLATPRHPDGPGEPRTESSPRPSGLRRAIRAAVAVVLVVGIFVGVLPQIADFREVWAAITDMTWVEVASLVLAAAWNLATYTFVTVAVLPGLGYWQAFVVGQSSTAIAATLPAGSAIGIGVTYSMYSSWGRSGSEIALATVLTGIWNNFVKLGLPIVALAALAIVGRADAALVAAALLGVAVLVGAVVLFALTLHSDVLARRVGNAVGRAVDAVRRAVRRPRETEWGEGTVRFRASTIALLRHRSWWLTAATVLSHLSLYVVLLLSLRHMGVAEEEVSWAEALGVFALVRLVTALPVTPGGLGLVELGLIGGLVAAGGDRAGVVAATLVYRFLTLVVQVPIGAVAYLAWRARMGRAPVRG